VHLLHAVIFGIVEGISEFLPISSTGHLILAAKIMKVSQSDFIKSFEIIIQLGAICSVIALYYKSLFMDLRVVKKLLAAFIPTGIIGFALYKLVKKFLLGNSHIVIWSLLLGGIFLVIFELLHREKAEATDDIGSISYKQAVLIGLFQTISIIPGVSRSAATIIGGLISGLKRKTIVEFSFLMAVPTMLAAAALDVSKNVNSFTHGQFAFLLVGFITSFIVALCAIKFLLAYIQKHGFVAFGIYRIALAVIFLYFWGIR